MAKFLFQGFAPACAAIASLALANVAAAQSQTIVVDEAGGPGSQFTDLPPAVAAASPGDVIKVRAGAYTAFTLSKNVTIVGEWGVVVDPGIVVTGIPPGDEAVLAYLDCGTLQVTNCSATVVFDHCTFTGFVPPSTSGNPLILVDHCADVRFHRVLAQPNEASSGRGALGLRAINARVELASCTIYGGKGADWGVVSAKAGGIGVDCGSGSRVHLALSEVFGGQGGHGYYFALQNGGSGGDGIEVAPGAVAILAGVAANDIKGGPSNGPYTSQGPFPLPGYAVDVLSGGTLRYSGVTIPAGTYGIRSFGTVVHATPDDPTVEVAGSTYNGDTLTFTVHGSPGNIGRLQQGNQALVSDDGQAVIEKLCNRIRQHPLGVLPASGAAQFTYVVPTTWPVGFTRFFQGYQYAAPLQNLIDRANSVAVVVP